MIRAAVALLVAVGLGSAADGAPPGCTPANINACGTARVDGTPSEFRGAIIVPGSDVVNREVARSGGCDGCQWFLVVDCDPNNPPDGGGGGGGPVHCNAARCVDGTMHRVYLQRPTDRDPVYLDTVCLTPTRRIVTAAELDADMERYLTALRPPAPEIAAQPARRAVVGIPTYFVARGARTDRQRLDVETAAGPATLLIEVAAARYDWTFGDGGRCETAAPGAPYDGGEAIERCDDRVAHVYRAARDATVTLRATWRGTYSFDVGFGPVGPLPIPGDGVVGPAATRTVEVRPARAELVGG